MSSVPSSDKNQLFLKPVLSSVRSVSPAAKFSTQLGAHSHLNLVNKTQKRIPECLILVVPGIQQTRWSLGQVSDWFVVQLLVSVGDWFGNWIVEGGGCPGVQ